MTPRPARPARPALALAAVVALCTSTVGACGDDGNDQASQRRRAAALADELRAAATTTPTPAVDDPSTEATASTGPAPTEVPPVEPTGVVVPVVALDNSFRPQTVGISVGDEVLWENRGMNEHDVLRVEGDGWGVEVADFQPGDVYAHVFTEPGEYRYYCSIHGNEDVGMVGTVVVVG